MERPLILHATDLSPASEAAFRHALKIALAVRGRLRIVHVHGTSQPAAGFEAFPQVRATLAAWGLIEPDAPAAAVADRLGLTISKAEATARRPESGLARLASRETPALVVLGTAGRDGLERLRHGSFAEALARHAKAPALFIPDVSSGFVGGADGAVGLRSVLIPAAISPSAAGAVKAALRLISALGGDATAHMLHVGREETAPPVPPGGRACRLMVREGRVVETIVAVADELDADLVAMATAGHDSLLDAVRGSITEQVLRRAGRPLLAVPA